MEKLNVGITRKLDLCISCEICSAVCPQNAISMEYRFGQFSPKVTDRKCDGCRICIELCPGIDIDPFKLRAKEISEEIFDGPCLHSYTAFSKDCNLRKNSTSGGIITSFVSELLKNKEFEKAFVLHFDKFESSPVRVRAFNQINEVLLSAKSKYIPASVYNVIKTLQKKDNKRYIIVGTPCQIYGIKKFLVKNDTTEKNLFFLGLFCDRTLNLNVIQFFEERYKRTMEKLVKFEFRTKEKCGWPGNSKIYFDSGREVMVDRKVRIQLKKFFQMNRCLFCLDKLNRLADISFGDCYIEGKENPRGSSSVIVRTNKGKKYFDKYSYLFVLEKENINKIRKSQNLKSRRTNLEFAKLIICDEKPYPNIGTLGRKDFKASKKLTKLKRYIEWGKNYNLNKIKYTLFVSEIISKLKVVYGYFRNYIKKTVAVIIINLMGFLFLFIGKRTRSSNELKEDGNVVIVGGELFNKGAQSMTFTTVDQIKRRFNNKKIFLFSTRDFERNKEEKDIYKFDILPWDFKIRIKTLLGNWVKFFIKESKYDYLEDDIRKIIKNADYFIDISGYALSSQRGLFNSACYLLNIIIAKKYSVPYYIFPQSIGPFSFPIKPFLYPLVKLCLKYPIKVLVREKEGIEYVNKFTKINVEKAYDIVLQSKEYNLSNIFSKDILIKDMKIKSNSVGIIPNLRVVEMMDSEKIYLIYEKLISTLLKAQKTVYLLRHSYEDLEICENIKNLFPNDEDVILILDDLNAIELENIIRRFDFVIASRYHSVIHSYKNGVPALVIGWATKYFELLRNFDQLDYFFDCRNYISIDEINNKTDNMVNNYCFERERIINKLNNLNKKNVFDMFNKIL